MSFAFEGLQLLVWQKSWLHASAPAIIYALTIYAVLIWVTWVMTRALMDVEFDFEWQTPAWMRNLFFWLGFFAFVSAGAALGWWLNQMPIYDYDEPLMILGAGVGALAFQMRVWRWLRRRHRARR